MIGILEVDANYGFGKRGGCYNRSFSAVIKNKHIVEWAQDRALLIDIDTLNKQPLNRLSILYAWSKPVYVVYWSTDRINEKCDRFRYIPMSQLYSLPDDEEYAVIGGYVMYKLLYARLERLYIIRLTQQVDSDLYATFLYQPDWVLDAYVPNGHYDIIICSKY